MSTIVLLFTYFFNKYDLVIYRSILGYQLKIFSSSGSLSRLSNIRLTCICAFAVALSIGKVGAKACMKTDTDVRGINSSEFSQRKLVH